jgi:hypothetical protein
MIKDKKKPQKLGGKNINLYTKASKPVKTLSQPLNQPK